MIRALLLVHAICTIVLSPMKPFTFIFLCLLFVSCDGGLEPPPPVEPGLSGSILFTQSTWPPADSLTSIMLVASKIYPLDSAMVFSGLFSNPPSIFLYPEIGKSLPFFVDSISFVFPLHSGTYKYIGVIQQVSSDILTRGIRVFKVVGFYKDPNNLSLPGSVIINENSQTTGIHIQVDFRNPPPQPF